MQVIGGAAQIHMCSGEPGGLTWTGLEPGRFDADVGCARRAVTKGVEGRRES